MYIEQLTIILKGKGKGKERKDMRRTEGGKRREISKVDRSEWRKTIHTRNARLPIPLLDRSDLFLGRRREFRNYIKNGNFVRRCF